MFLSRTVRILLTSVIIASLGTLVLGYASNFRSLERCGTPVFSTYRVLSDISAFEFDGTGQSDEDEHFEPFVKEFLAFDCSGDDDSTRNGVYLFASRASYLFIPSTPKALTMHRTARETASLAPVLLPIPRSPPFLRLFPA